MMTQRDQIPFFLHEAVISLYPASADGTLLVAAPVWSGSLANGLRLRMSLDEVTIHASGAAHPRTNHIGEQHGIEIERSWLLRKADVRDFVPERNQQYALDIVWEVDGYWHRRIYYGVTGQTVSWDSDGTNRFVNSQVFHANYFTQTGGPGDPESVFTPQPLTDAEPVAFFRELPFITGEYLLGHYRWAAAVTLGVARLIAWPGQGADTVLTLEVNGVLTAKTITLPAGTANQDATVTTDLGAYAVPAGATVRWKITSGPAPEDAAWHAALTVEAAG
jgi:hypothetical protein